ncbi:uncharacterized protein C15orf39 homolog [Phaethornis superciliosus]
MASKRHSESLDPVIFNKVPRMEMEGPASAFPPVRGKSSPLPNPSSENHFNYKGSYFSCPLPTPEGPEQPLVRWSLASSYPPYGSAASSQPVPTPGLLGGSCLLYPPPSLAPGKAKDSLMQELLMAREKWPNPGHPFPVQKPVAVNKTPTLAIPRPIYRAPLCFVDPRVVLPPGPHPESLQQRPGDTEWALPATAPASHPPHPGEPHGGTGVHKRGPHTEPGLLSLHPGLTLPTTEKGGSPVPFSPYYSTFEKYRDPPGTPFLEASCPAAHSQKKVPEVPRLSPEPWPKLQTPPASPAFRDRSPACFPHTPCPLPLLYPPPEAQPGTFSGFGFAGSGEPFPGTYLKPQGPQSYFPNPLDPYVPRAAGAAASPLAKAGALLGDAEPPRPAGYLPSPQFAFSPGDRAVGAPGTELDCDQQQAESPPQQAAVRHPDAFQPLCTPEKLPRGSSRLEPKGEGGWVKDRQGEQEPPYPVRRRDSPAPQDTHPPAAIILKKGDACKIKGAVPTSPATSPPGGLKAPGDGEVSPPSPPMPVINNVFSLAPYRDYLEGTQGSGQVPFPKDHFWEDTPLRQTGGSQDPAALGDNSATSSQLPMDMAASQALKMGSDGVQSQEKKRRGKVPKKPTLGLQDVGSPEGSPGGVGSEDPAPEAVVLDLSLKKNVVKGKERQGPIGPMERTPAQEDVEEEKEGLEGKVRVGEGAKPQTPPLLLEVKSNFQSSATFMFKKFKIWRSLPASSVPPSQASAPQHSPSALPGATPDSQQSLLPEAPRVPGEERAWLPGPSETPAPQSSAGQYFTSLHTLLCHLISCSVSRSSPQLLQEWLKKAEPVEELREVPRCPPKPKNSSRIPEPHKPTKGKEIWLAFQDVASLLTNLLSQLETFMFARKCPFPHVVRAGAVFIPIHVVKEKLFPKLPGASVDQVLQEHKVELRPTTLSEERHLRDLELKSCTSRMLKLLALKQLPDIYPDLLNLHWHHSIRQQLGSPGMEALKAAGKAGGARRKKRTWGMCEGQQSWPLPMASSQRSRGVRQPDPMDVTPLQLEAELPGQRDGAVALGPAAPVATRLRCKAFLLLATTAVLCSLGVLLWGTLTSSPPSPPPLGSAASQRETGDNLEVAPGDLPRDEAVQQPGGALMGSAGVSGCSLGVEGDVSSVGWSLQTPTVATQLALPSEGLRVPSDVPAHASPPSQSPSTADCPGGDLVLGTSPGHQTRAVMVPQSPSSVPAPGPSPAIGFSASVTRATTRSCNEQKEEESPDLAVGEDHTAAPHLASLPELPSTLPTERTPSSPKTHPDTTWVPSAVTSEVLWDTRSAGPVLQDKAALLLDTGSAEAPENGSGLLAALLASLPNASSAHGLHRPQHPSTARDPLPGPAGEPFTPAELVTLGKPPELSSPVHVLPLQFRLLGIAYTHTLSRRSSERYQELEGEVRLMLNQMLSTYETFLQANVLEFLNGSVVVRGEALFRGDVPAPTNSHLIRTLVTEANRERSIFSWRLEPQSIQSSGFGLENLDAEKLSISLSVFQLGRSRTDTLERVISEVTGSLSALYHVRNFTVAQLRNISGGLEVTGDIYLDTIVHADVAEVVQALTALAACSVDLTSLWVEGARPHLQVYPFSFLVTNRAFSPDLLDPLAMEQQELTRDLGDVHPAPTSLEILEALVLSVGPRKTLAGSDFEVDPYSLTVGEDTLEPPLPDPGFPEYGVAIVVVGGLCLITAPIIVLMVGFKNSAPADDAHDTEQDCCQEQPFIILLLLRCDQDCPGGGVPDDKAHHSR